MAYIKKAEREKEFINLLLAIGIKSHGSCDDHGSTYWFFNLENGQQRYWTNLSEKNQKKIRSKRK